jgi:hypothetical protein
LRRKSDVELQRCGSPISLSHIASTVPVQGRFQFG